MIRQLKARLAALKGELHAMNKVAVDAEGNARDFSAEETAKYDGVKAQLETTQRALDRAIEAGEEERAAPAAAAPAADVRVEMGQVRRELDPRGGFASRAEFYDSVIRASVTGTRDRRLVIDAAAPTTFGNEGSAVDGGFLVPPEFASDIFTLALTDDALLPYTDTTPVSGNSMVFPKDETTPWGTDGVRAYWQSEASVATQTKPKFGTSVLRLHKLMGLVPLTDELVADSRAGGAFVTPLIARSIRWKVNEAILFGTGAGQPLGCMNSGAAVTQNKDSGQAANTVSALNVANMRFRLPTGSYRNAVWLITPDALPLVVTLTLGNYPIYMGIPGGIQNAPDGTLMGRPVVPSQHVGALSALGDLSLVDLSYYRTITKAGAGVETASSLHLYFDADAVAFRSTFRIDGQPKLSAAIAQAKGSNTLSPFIQLQNR